MRKISSIPAQFVSGLHVSSVPLATHVPLPLIVVQEELGRKSDDTITKQGGSLTFRPALIYIFDITDNQKIDFEFYHTQTTYTDY